MRQRRFRLGIRAQLTLVVLLGAVLSTLATLFIANNAIQQYALQQAHTQEQQNMAIALLVLQTQYGQNISIASNGQLVADTPTTGHDLSGYAQNNYGKYYLKDDEDYVDQVQHLIGGFVSVYQCANSNDKLVPCVRISTTLRVVSSNANSSVGSTRDTGVQLEPVPASAMTLSSAPKAFLGEVDYQGQQYYADYYPLFNPQQQVIGVLAVGVPLANVTDFQRATTIQLLLLGLIVMIAGVIFSLLFASSIVSTLQNVARQVSYASQRIGAIASQQVGGAEQQVWAVGSINKALQNFAETTREISHRTDQLAQMGDQVVRRRVDILPQQIDTILAYITRSVRDISSASRQEAQQYERMTGAMQAVMEIAEQVSNGSQQATDSAHQLDEAVADLQQIVGVRAIRQSTTATMDVADFPSEAMLAGAGALPPSQANMGGMGQMGGMGSMGQMGQRSSGQMGVRGDRNMRMGSGNMGRMPDTAASLGGALPAHVMGAPMGAPMNGPTSGMLPPNGQMRGMRPMNGNGQMGGMRPMGTDGHLPPLGGPMDTGGYAGRVSYGGDGRQDLDYGAPMPPLPDFPGSGSQGMMGGQMRNAAPPPGRTRGVRGPLSGPRNNSANGQYNGQNSGPANTSLPDWLTEREDGSR